MEIECIKSAARPLNSNWVNKEGLDLSKDVLWVSVGLRAAELPAVKVGGKKHILLLGSARPGLGMSVLNQAEQSWDMLDLAGISY